MNFYHQFKFVLSYSIVDGDTGASAPVLTATQAGSAYTPTLTGTATDYWLDATTSWAVDNPLTGSAGNERWQTATTASGTVSATQTTAYLYYHQFQVAFEYSFNNGGGLAVPSDPTAYYTQFGSAQTITALTGGAVDWVDATTAIQYDNPLSAIANERWQADFTVSSGKSTIVSSVSGSTLTPSPDYFLQVLNTFTVTGVSGSDTVVLTGSLYGSSPVTIVTLSTGNGWSTTAWSDRNTAVTFPATSSASTGSERWALSGGAASTGALAAGGGSYSHAYTHQFLVSFAYTVNYGSLLVSQSNLVTYTQFTGTMHLSTDGSGVLSASSDWADAGTTVLYNSAIAIGGAGHEQYMINSADAGTHTVISSVGTGAVTANPLYYHQYKVDFSYSTSDLSDIPNTLVVGHYWQFGSSNDITSDGLGGVSPSVAVWVDAGVGTVNFVTATASSNTERWALSSSPQLFLVNTWGTAYETSYYHQFSVSFSFTTNDGSNLASQSNVVTYQHFGSATYLSTNSGGALTPASTEWVDAGSAVTYASPIAIGLSGDEQYMIASGDGGSHTVIATVDSTHMTASAEYYHQFSVSFAYTTSDASTLNSKANLVTYTQFGSTMHLSTDAFGVLSKSSDWADATTSVLYNSPISISANEAYKIALADSGTSTVISSVGSSHKTANPEYFRQMKNTFDATFLDGSAGASDSIDVNGTAFGVPATIAELNTGNGWSTTGWTDYGTTATFPITTTLSSGTERWASSGDTYGPITTGGAAYGDQYIHQYLIYFDYTTSDASPLISQTNLITYTSSTATSYVSTDGSGALTVASDWVDATTAILYNSPIAISGDERYMIASGDGGSHTVVSSLAASGTVNPTYYHQLQNTFAVSGLSAPDYVAVTGTYFGTSGSTIVTLNSGDSYSTAGWVDYGTTVTFPGTSHASTGTERWALYGNAYQPIITTSGGTISPPTSYVHQFMVSFAYTTNDATALASQSSMVAYTQFGSTSYLSTDGSGALSKSSDWADAGTAVLYNSPIAIGLAGTEQYIIDSADTGTNTVISSVGTGAVTANPEYYHQFSVIFQYSVTDGSPSAPTAHYKQFGGAYTVIAATDHHVIQWVDAGTAVSYDNPISASGTERWQADYTVVGGLSQIVSSVSGSTLTIDPTYYHQFKVTFEYTVIGGGSPAAPTAYYTQFGLSDSMTADSGGGAFDWADAGTTVAYPTLTSDSTSSEQWSIDFTTVGGLSYISTSVDSSTSPTNPDYYHQYSVTFGYSVVNDASNVPSGDIGQYYQFGSWHAIMSDGAGAVSPSAATWVDAGTANVRYFLISASSTEEWASHAIFLGGGTDYQNVAGAGSYTESYYHQYLVTFTYSTSDSSSVTPPAVVYYQFGSAVLGNHATGFSDWTDAASSVFYANPISISGTERYMINLPFSAGYSVVDTVSGADTVDPTYYHQYHVTLSYTTNDSSAIWDSDASSNLAIGSYTQFGNTVTLYSSPSGTYGVTSAGTVWLDAGYNNVAYGTAVASSGVERWALTSTSYYNVLSSATITETGYYHQWLVSFDYTTNDGSAISNQANLVFYTQFGGAMHLSTNQQGVLSLSNDWVDVGTSINYASPVSISGHERYQISTSDLGPTHTVIASVGSASRTADPEYFHQWSVAFLCTTQDESVIPTSSIVGSFQKFGVTQTLSIDSSGAITPASAWVDAGTAQVTFNTVAYSGTEQWALASSPNNINVDTFTVINEPYYHQYQVTFSYSVVNDGTHIANGLTVGHYFQFGASQAITSDGSGGVTPAAATWVDAGTGKVTYVTAIASSNTERWALAGSQDAKTVSGTGTVSESGYYHQYLLTVVGGNGVTFGTASLFGDQWYNSGASTTVSSNGIYNRASGVGQRISSWQVDSNPATSVATTGTVTTTSITMSGAHTLTFTSVTQYQVTLDATSTAALNSITSPTISGDNYWYDSGTAVNVLLNGVWNRAAGTGTRLAGYSINGLTITPTSTTGTVTLYSGPIASSESFTAISVTQYQVTLDATTTAALNTITSPTVSGDTYWYDSGTPVTLVLNGVWNRAGGTGTRLTGYVVNGGSNTPTSTVGGVTVLSGAISSHKFVTATSTTQYQVTLDATSTAALNSITSPTVSGDNYWYDSGTPVTVVLNGVWARGTGTTGNRLTGYALNGGTGVSTATTGAVTVMNGAISGHEFVTAASVTQYEVTLDATTALALNSITSPTISGDNYWYDSGTTVTVVLNGVWARGTGTTGTGMRLTSYALNSGTSTTTLTTGTVTALTSAGITAPQSITATSVTQYQVTLDSTSLATLNSITPATISGDTGYWYDSGTPVTVVLNGVWARGTGTTGNRLTGYALNGGAPTTTLTTGAVTVLSGAISSHEFVTATGVVQYELTFNSGAASALVSVTSPTISGDNYWYDAGTTGVAATLNGVYGRSPSTGSGTRVSSYSWDSATSIPESTTGTFTTTTMTMSATHQINAATVTQYLVTLDSTTTNALNSITPATISGDTGYWYDSGTSVSLVLNGIWSRGATTGTRLTGYAVNGVTTPTATTATVTVLSGAISGHAFVTATSTAQYFLTVTGGNTVVYGTAPAIAGDIGWYDSGTSTTVSSDWVWNTASGQRTAVSNWQLDSSNQYPTRQGSGTLTTTPIVMNAAHTVSFISVTQYYLTVNGGNSILYGTVSPTNDNWYDSGTATWVSSNGVYSRTSGVGQRVTTWQVDSNSPVAVATAGTVITSTVVMTAPHTVTFTSVTQYQVTLDTTSTAALNSITLPTITGDNYWYDTGTPVTVVLNGIWSRTTNTGMRLTGYALNGGAMSSDPLTTSTVTVFTGAIANHEFVTATSVTQYFLTVTGGNNIAYGTASTVAGDTGWYDSGTSTTVSSNWVWNTIAGQSRTAITNYAIDGVSQNPARQGSGTLTTSAVTMNSPQTVTFASVTQYYLTDSTLIGSKYSITASPTSDGWYDSGTSVNVVLNNIWAVTSGSRLNLISYTVDSTTTTVTRSGSGTVSVPTITMTTYHAISDAAQAQYLLTLEYSIANSPPGSPTVTGIVTYTTFGNTATATPALTATTTVWADVGSAVTYASPIVSGSERWIVTSVDSTTYTAVSSVTAAATVDPSYYHQYQVSSSYSTSDNSTPSASVVLTDTQFGSSGTLTLTTETQSPWLDAGSTWSVNNPIAASGTEHWIATSGTSGTVGASSAIAPLYYHQYKVTASYSTSDTSTPSVSVTLSGTQSGSSAFTATLTTTTQSIWLDATTAWSVNNPITSSTQRWDASSGTSGTVNSAVTIAPMYYHQYQLTLEYNIANSPAGTPTVTNIVSYTTLGTATTATPALTATTQVWVDANSAVRYNSPIVSGSERWIVTSVDSTTYTAVSSVTAAATVNPSYYNQFQLTLEYNIVNSPVGTPTVTNIVSYTGLGTAGLTATPAVAPTATTTVWADAGSAVTYASPIVSGSERWIVTSADSTTYTAVSSVTAAATVNPAYYNQFQLTLEYSIANTPAGTPTVTNIVTYTSLGTAGLTATPALTATTTVWADAGSAVTYSSPIVSGTERWIVTSADSTTYTAVSSVTSAATVKPTYYNQFQLTLEYSIANTPAGNPTVTNVASYTSFGTAGQTATPTLAPTATAKVWADAGSALKYNSPIVSSNERWIVTSADAGTYTALSSVTATATANPSYYNQYQIPANYTTSDNSTPTSSIILTGTQYGSSAFSLTLTTATQLPWLDAGSTWAVNNTITSGTQQWVPSNGIIGTVSATLTIVPIYAHQYQITFAVSPASAGTTSPSGTQWENVGVISLSSTANTGYNFGSWSGGGNSIASVSSATTTATITGAGTITANFALITYQITVTQTSGGTISPGTSSVNYGSSQTFTITPTSGYYITDVKVDGSSVGTPTTHTFTNVLGTHSITATYAPMSASATFTVPATLTSTNTSVNIQVTGNATLSGMTITSYSSNSTTAVRFTINGQSGSSGFINMTLPISDIAIGTVPSVYIDGQLAANQGFSQDGTNYYVWFTTHFSTHQIDIQFSAPSSTTTPTATPAPTPNTLYYIVAVVVIVAVVIALAGIMISRRKKTK